MSDFYYKYLEPMKMTNIVKGTINELTKDVFYLPKPSLLKCNDADA
jgi:hypothetical protein